MATTPAVIPRRIAMPQSWPTAKGINGQVMTPRSGDA